MAATSAHARGRALAVTLALAASHAHAQAGPPSDVALAEALFREAKTLMGQGRYAEACPRLAESQRLDPGAGTLLTLALCLEGEGKTASAWVAFSDAARLAAKDGRADREKLARKHMDDLDKVLCKLVLRVPDAVASLPGLEVAVDGKQVARAVFGVPTPVDPGVHHVLVRARGKQDARLDVVVDRPGAVVSVDVPSLVDAAPVPVASAPSASSAPVVSVPPPPPKEPVAAPASEPSSPARPVRTLAYGALGVSAVALGVGAYFGLRAKSAHDDATTRCPQSPCSDRAGVDANEDARAAANVANVASAIGFVALTTGVVLFVLSPGDRGTGVAVRGGALPGGASLGMGGAF